MTYNLISDLRANAGSLTNNFSNLLGYYVIGDGGGGDFYWDSASTETDNGGTIIGSFSMGRWKRLFSSVLDVKWFGTKGDGIALDDPAIFNCITEAMSSGVDVYIPQGSYLITEGALAFDNGFTNKPFPNIYTAGDGGVIFVAAGINPSPFITLTNGTATSDSGNYWEGGIIGGINFTDSHSGRSGVHGISLTGVKGMKFGELRGDYLNGSLVYCPTTLYAGTDPDPYAVWFCQFDLLEANYCQGYALENQNYLGFNANIINNLRAISCVSGGYFGFGAGNIINIASIAGCSGWAFDDGTNVAATGGAPLKFIVNTAELDTVQYGIRLNRSILVSFNEIRFNYNYQTGPGVYWPITAVSFCAGATPECTEIYMNLVHRIDSGGPMGSQVGPFIDGSNNPNIANVSIDNRILDNAGPGVMVNALFANINPSTSMDIKQNGKLIFDSNIKIAALVNANTGPTGSSISGTVTDFAAFNAKVTFPNVRYDRTSNYSVSGSDYTIPYTGLYRVNASINLILAAGSCVTLGVVRVRGAASVNAGVDISYAAASSVSQIYEINRLIDFVAGDIAYIAAVQNTGTPVNLSFMYSTVAENQFSIQVV